MNRRRFLQSSLAAASTLTLRAGALRVKAGMLGASHSHAAEKLRLLQLHPAFEFVGAVDPSEKVRARYPGVRWISRTELFAQAEGAVIESAVREHAPDAIEALSAGLHVHLEKPASANWPDMVRIAQLAREKKRVVQVGYMWRHNPGFVRIFEAVRQGWLGEVFQVRAMMNNLLAPGMRAEWAEFAGGSFFEQAAHLVDAVIRLLGRPRRVIPVLQSARGDELKDNNAAVFEFDRALATITNSTHQPNAFAHRNFEVYGTNGTMILRPIEPPNLRVDFRKAAGPYPAGESVIQLPRYERYRGEFDELARCVREKAPLPVNLDTEMLVQEWLLRASTMWAQ